MNVFEGQAAVVLEDDLGGDFPVDDPLEKGLFTHGVSCSILVPAPSLAPA